MTRRRASAMLRGPEGHEPAFLLDASTGYEAALLRKWLFNEVGPDADALRITSSKRGTPGDAPALEELIADRDRFAIPLRVVWLPPRNRQGERSVKLSDIFKPGDPRDPRGLRARWIRMMRPKRVRLIAAPGALVGRMLDDYELSGQLDPASAYVTRRAWRALDRGERKLQGNKYKIPRFVPEAILSRRDYAERIDEAANKQGLAAAAARVRAERYLREIAATHSPYVIDLIAAGIKKLYGMGYGQIKYDRSEVAKVAELGQDNPIVFLPSHRSNLDRLSLQFMLWENDLPPNHTAGGINLNFFPLGPLVRRTGVFFIRRSFRENELYKVVLRSYLEYLVEKRFPLEWYMEGGRSRSGRLLPPKMGMLSYVVDALRRGKAEDIKLIPVSIAYDQIQDVPDYAREAQGKSKEKESIGWLLKAIRSLRRRYGDIYITFGEPLSVVSALEQESGDDHGEETGIAVQKIAFEVMYRIGQATPVTPTAIVSIVLLAERGTARTASEITERATALLTYLHVREVPLTDESFVGDEQSIPVILENLVENGYVSTHKALGRQVFWLDDDQMVKISYYRNMVLHFFVPRAMAEMALTSISGNGSTAEDFENSMLLLRDLLKFEFFFAEKDEFLIRASRDLSIDVPEWRTTIERHGGRGVLEKLGPPIAYWALLPFLDAYQIVGDELEATSGVLNEKAFLKACLARARMYRIEQRLISGESASQVLFKSALGLADNRNLLRDEPGVHERRKAFAEEIRLARGLAATGL